MRRRSSANRHELVMSAPLTSDEPRQYEVTNAPDCCLHNDWDHDRDYVGFSGYFVLQCFHAFTYAIMHTGMQHKLVERVVESQEASAQGLYFFYTGIFTAIFTFLSGYFYAWYGVNGFYSMSVVAFAGCCFAVTAWYLQPQRRGSGGKTSEAS